VVANTSSVQKLDPQIATSFLDLQALGLIYQPLVTLSSSLQVVPDLASSWTFSSDSKSVTFTLRSGVKFDDGTSLTSADVKASLERVLNPKTGAAAASNISTVASISAPTPQTVTLKLTHPDFSILYGLTTTNLSILPASAITAGTIASKPDGTGPFTFVSWSPGTSLTLAKNPSYWGGAPSIKQVVFRTIPDEQSVASALQAGTVQMGLLTQPQVVKTLGGSLQVDKELDLNYRALMLQDRTGPLANADARLAIGCALNRTDILANAALGQGKVVGPVPLGPYAPNPAAGPCGTQNLSQAAQYLAKAGMSRASASPRSPRTRWTRPVPGGRCCATPRSGCASGARTPSRCTSSRPANAPGGCTPRPGMRRTAARGSTPSTKRPRYAWSRRCRDRFPADGQLPGPSRSPGGRVPGGVRAAARRAGERLPARRRRPGVHAFGHSLRGRRRLGAAGQRGRPGADTGRLP
jgi:ABC-type transport system substrate-binding protein